MKQERFEQLRAEAAPDYNRPPETPREEMWAAIQRERRHRAASPAVARPRPSWVVWGVGMAAALLLGVALGRMQPRDSAAGSNVAAEGGGQPTEAALRAAYEYAALEHLRRAETFLMGFQMDAAHGLREDGTGSPAEDLLLNTRLLQDSPVAQDPAFRTVLDDLELVLAQIVQLRAARGRYDEELEYIGQGMEQRGVLSKLRSAIETDPAFAQGETE